VGCLLEGRRRSDVGRPGLHRGHSMYERPRMVFHLGVEQVDIGLQGCSGRRKMIREGRCRRRRRREFGVCPRVLASAGHGLHRVSRVAASHAPQLREVGCSVWWVVCVFTKIETKCFNQCISLLDRQGAQV
jgi:hypothetical protein